MTNTAISRDAARCLLHLEVVGLTLFTGAIHGNHLTVEVLRRREVVLFAADLAIVRTH